MCISIVFAAQVTNNDQDKFIQRVYELGCSYNYGIGMGEKNLPPAALPGISASLPGAGVIFEVHDRPEPHCACDIDHDIRLGSKLDRRSKFFDFVEEISAYQGLTSLAVMFFQEEKPSEANVRKHLGTYEEFVNLINRWHTWQVAAFEPVREAYYIADESPLLFVFTGPRFTQ